MAKTTKSPKTGAKAVSPHCGNHGGCPVCEANRTKRKQAIASLALALEGILEVAETKDEDEDG